MNLFGRNFSKGKQYMQLAYVSTEKFKSFLAALFINLFLLFTVTSIHNLMSVSSLDISDNLKNSSKRPSSKRWHKLSKHVRGNYEEGQKLDVVGIFIF